MVAKIKLKQIVNLMPQCPHCAGETSMVKVEKLHHLECGACGAQSYRYDDPALAIRDFPNHHGLPKRKRG